MKKIITLLALISFTAFGQQAKQNKNRELNADVKICVNEGGVEKCPLIVKGSTADVFVGDTTEVGNFTKIAEGGTHVSIKGGNNSTPLLNVDGPGTADRIRLLKNGAEVFVVEDDGATTITNGLRLTGQFGSTDSVAAACRTGCTSIDAAPSDVTWFKIGDVVSLSFSYLVTTSSVNSTSYVSLPYPSNFTVNNQAVLVCTSIDSSAIRALASADVSSDRFLVDHAGFVGSFIKIACTGHYEVN